MNESPSTQKHKRTAPITVGFAVVVISTGVARGEREDRSGAAIAELIEGAGHQVVARETVSDDAAALVAVVTALAARDDVKVIVTTGGTGLTAGDVTIEALRPLFRKEIPGFAVLFMQLSHGEVGAACMLSRAMAGILDRAVLFALPGSPAACRLAVERLILPEAGHILRHVKE